MENTAKESILMVESRGNARKVRKDCPCCGEKDAILQIQLPLLGRRGYAPPSYNSTEHAKKCKALRGTPAERKKILQIICQMKLDKSISDGTQPFNIGRSIKNYAEKEFEKKITPFLRYFREKFYAKN